MKSVLKAIGYTQSYLDASIYIYFKDNIRIILPVFVDNMTLASKSEAVIDKTIKELSYHFKLHNLGPTTQLLGIKIDRDRKKHFITISQHQYCLDILECSGMADCKPISTPMQPNTCLTHSQSPQTPEEVVHEICPLPCCSWCPDILSHYNSTRYSIYCWLPC